MPFTNPKDGWGQTNSRIFNPVYTFRTQPGGAQPSDNSVFLHARLLKDKQVGHRNHIAFHPLDFGDLDHFARTIAQAFQVANQLNSGRNLFADRATRTSILGWEFPSGYFQSLQPLFIITLAPVFAWIWIRLGTRQPSSPAKFALGLLFVGSGFALLVVAAQLAENGVKVAPYWLAVTYLLHTLGELSLSPVGMSAFTKLAPARVAGLMMGVFYLAIAGGNFIGGRLASLYGSMPLPQLFGLIAAVGIGAGLVMFALTPPIKRLMGDIN